MAVVERQTLDSLRSQVQRKLASQIDVGAEAVAPAEVVPPPVAPQGADRRRFDRMRAEAQRSVPTRIERRGISSFMPRSGLGLRPSRIALVLVALAAGGLAAFLATERDPAASRPVAQPVVKIAQVVQAPTTRILVAKETIGVGQRLTPAMLGWEDWPQTALRPEYVTATSTPGAITDMAGLMARFELFAGEPISAAQLAPAGTSYLSAILDKGMRAVSVSVAADSASGGFIVPNDHVDVVLTRTNGTDHDAETIISNVRVLAINAKLGATGSPTGSGDATADVFSGQGIATLELDPLQSNVIADAATIGKLSLVLRSSTDAVDTGTAEERALNASIRLSSPFWTTGVSTGATPQPPR